MLQPSDWVEKAKSGEKDLTWAKLTGAKLTGAILAGADLTGAKLTGADMSDAIVSRSTTEGVDFNDWISLGGIVVD